MIPPITAIFYLFFITMPFFKSGMTVLKKIYLIRERE